MSTNTSATAKETRYSECPRCARRRKMMILRHLDETGLEWLNCNACNALVCLTHDPENDTFGDVRIIGDYGDPAPEEFRTYVPEEDYEIGEFIYHQTWRDVGKVIGTRKMPGGRWSIDVAFLNYGAKSLIIRSEPVLS